MTASIISIIKVVLVLVSNAVDYFRRQALVNQGKAQERAKASEKVEAIVTTATKVNQELTDEILDDPEFDKENVRD
jgi:hypothetical protein